MFLMDSDHLNHPEIDDNTSYQWSVILNLLAEVMDTPVSLIMKVSNNQISVLLKNNSPDNPYTLGHAEVFHGSGLYCEQVVSSNSRLLVVNALEDERWHDNPDVKLSLINYLGYPIKWPNGDVYGTLCILDYKTRRYTETQESIMIQFRCLIESSLIIREKNNELENLNKLLQSLSNTDDLTGILNRRAFLAQSEMELERSLRSGSDTALLMLDLDDFKDVNDLYGHSVGDQVLKDFTSRVMLNMRAIDIFGRLGGEEFGILLPEISSDKALQMAERLRFEIEKSTIQMNSAVIRYTVSIGVANCKGGNQSTLDMMQIADKKLYEAKRNSKNQVVM